MEDDLPTKLLNGYNQFREKYAAGDQSVMQALSVHGQSPKILVIACSDSRVDPALIFQCDPGDLFIVRNVASIVPPFEKDSSYHGTSAAIEFAVRFLEVKHIVLLGHSQCGGIEALVNDLDHKECDFIRKWVSIVETDKAQQSTVDDYVKVALQKSYQNCLTFPWLKKRYDKKELTIHKWFFEIKSGSVYTHSKDTNTYEPLVAENLTLD